MTDIFGQIGCSSNNAKRMTSAFAGALVATTGSDTMFAAFGAPPALHYALAGVVVDVSCRGVGTFVDPLVETAMSGFAGYAGAMIAQSVLPMILSR